MTMHDLPSIMAVPLFDLFSNVERGLFVDLVCRLMFRLQVTGKCDTVHTPLKGPTSSTVPALLPRIIFPHIHRITNHDIATPRLCTRAGPVEPRTGAIHAALPQRQHLVDGCVATKYILMLNLSAKKCDHCA